MIEQLAERLSARLSDEVRARGRASFRTGRVSLQRHDRASASARVVDPRVEREGAQQHEVRLASESNGRWTASCSCAAFRGGAACSHLWATVLELRERDLLSSAPEPAAPRRAASSPERGAAHDAAPRAGIAPRGALHIEAATQDNARGRLRCSIRFDYEGALVAADSEAELAIDPHGRAAPARRDRAAERALLEGFQRAGGCDAGDGGSEPAGSASTSARRAAALTAASPSMADASGARAAGSLAEAVAGVTPGASLGPAAAAAVLDEEARGSAPRGAVDDSTECQPAPLDPASVCIVARALPLVVRELLSDAWLVEAGETRYRAAGELSLELSEKLDWFELGGGLSFDEQLAELPTLLRSIEAGETTVELADGSIGLIPDSGLERLGLLDRLGVRTERTLRFHRSQGALLDAALPDEGEEDAPGESAYALSPTFGELRRRLRGSLDVLPEVEPESFLGTLRDYQRTALGWFRLLREMGMGGCLADDMGLGKTIQVLALIETRRAVDRTARPTLVVAPRSLTFNWIAEARAFAPQMLVLDYSGPGRRRWMPFLAEYDLVVTTYGTLRRDLEDFAQQPFDYVVLDEAQAIKNAASETSRAVRELVADHRLALSGTPIENHLGELAALFDFLNPGLFDPHTKIGALLDRRADLAREADRDLLRRALRPLILRRTKEAVLHELPPRNEQLLYCELGTRQRADYDELRDYYKSRLLAPTGAGGAADEGHSRFEVLAALLRLRQAACHPALVDPTRRAAEAAKLDTLLPLLEEIAGRGHKALVFSQFTRFLELVRTGVEARGLRCIQLDGSTRDRGALVNEFQTDTELPVFLISLMAGGAGLNLTAADYVFLLDPWWNPAVEAQAIGRAHRMGQRRTVMAYRLIAKDTVEEKVLELQRRKRELAQAVLDGEAGEEASSLSLEDIEALLE